MHLTTAAAVASGLILTRAVSAQTYPAFDKDAVSDSLKTFWCQQQVSACPLLCGDRETTTSLNECYPSNLYYSCVCSDGKSPDLQLYSQTIPYFTCSHVVEACVDNCNGNGICGQQCRENKPCGAQGDPLAKNKTKTDDKKSTKTTGSTALPTATDDGDDFEKGFGSTDDKDKDSDSDKDSGANSMFGKSSYGLATVIVGLAAGVTIFL